MTPFTETAQKIAFMARTADAAIILGRRGQAAGFPVVTEDFGRFAKIAETCGVAAAPGSLPFNFQRGRAVWSARQAHNLKVGGSNPPRATNSERGPVAPDRPATYSPAPPASNRSEKGTVDRELGAAVRTAASRPGSNFEVRPC